MALNIKDERTDRLARELARQTGESITVAARTAIEERLARVLAERSREPAAPALIDIVHRGRGRAELTTASADEIVGYDEHGLPA
jgi:antitoxin VapB